MTSALAAALLKQSAGFCKPHDFWQHQLHVWYLRLVLLGYLRPPLEKFEVKLMDSFPPAYGVYAEQMLVTCRPAARLLEVSTLVHTK